MKYQETDYVLQKWAANFSDISFFKRSSLYLCVNTFPEINILPLSVNGSDDLWELKLNTKCS